MRQGRMEGTENCISLFLVGATAVPGLLQELRWNRGFGSNKLGLMKMDRRQGVSYIIGSPW